MLLLATSAGVVRFEPITGTQDVVLAGNVAGLDRAWGGYAYGTSSGGVYICDAALAECAEWSGPNWSAIRHLLPGSAADHLYVLTAASEVFHTDDAGATWELIAREE